MDKEVFNISVKQVKSHVACCALSTRVGTRDENPVYNGLAHFTEHMLFKGTLKRGSSSINNTLENVGGELNAYTTKEETVLQATVLKEDLQKAVDLLLEMAFTSVFPVKELDKERDVILDEIISYKDSPAEAIYDQFESLLFTGHPLNMPILGEKKSLRRIDNAIFKEYTASNFIPSKMGFTVVADIDCNKVVKMVERSLGKYYKGDVQVIVVNEGDISGGMDGIQRANSTSYTKNGFEELKLHGEKFYTQIIKKNHQANCIIGTTAYSCFNEERLALAVLTNILGGPASGARLNMTLREKYALVYNVEASYTPYADTGIFAVYFGCDKGDVNKCIDLTKSEIEKIVSNKLSDSMLKTAKKQLLGQLSIAQDNAEAQCLSMGKSLIVYGKINTLEQMRSKIEGITAAQLQKVAKQVLAWDRMSVLIYC